jgi:Flp pilus assembly protein TadD
MNLALRWRLAAAALLLGLAGSAFGVDTPSEPPVAADPLATARGHIEAKRWPAALSELRRVNASSNADWNNLMGYALRKQTPPDLEGAQRHYDAALRINPRHMGALEYSGELALMKGDLATAEARVAALAKLCKTPCEPLDDLAKSVARFKANGGKV